MNELLRALAGWDDARLGEPDPDDDRIKLEPRLPTWFSELSFWAEEGLVRNIEITLSKALTAQEVVFRLGEPDSFYLQQQFLPDVYVPCWNSGLVWEDQGLLVELDGVNERRSDTVPEETQVWRIVVFEPGSDQLHVPELRPWQGFEGMQFEE